MNDLLWPQNMSRCDAGSRRPDVQGLGELNEFHAGGIRATQKDWHLKPYSGSPSALLLVQILTFLITFRFHSTAPVVLAN
jgi:hypothetical protein